MWLERRRERSSMPAGMCAYHDSSGSPNDTVRIPASRRCAATASPFGPAPTTTAGSRGVPDRRSSGRERASTRLPAELDPAGHRGPGVRAPADTGCTHVPARAEHAGSCGRTSGAQLPQAMAKIGVRPPVEHAGSGGDGLGVVAEQVTAPDGRQIGAGADRQRQRTVRARVHVDCVPVAVSLSISSSSKMPSQARSLEQRDDPPTQLGRGVGGLRVARVAGVRRPRALVARKRLGQQPTAGEHPGERSHPALGAALDQTRPCRICPSPIEARPRSRAHTLPNRFGGVTDVADRASAA